MFVKNGNLNETDLRAPRLHLYERDRAGGAQSPTELAESVMMVNL